jgi:HD-like signal output (HDOD) protein
MVAFVPATRFERTPNLEMRFPPLPKTVTEVSTLLAEQVDVPDTYRLVDIVNADPVTSASVLRRINSAYYGMRRRIGDIRKAVFLLGFLEVCNIVLTSGMMKLRDVLRTDEQVRIFDQIMRLCLGAAFYAQELAMHLKLQKKATAFTLGLLHASGRLVLLYNKPNDYEALWWTCDDGQAPTAEAEQLIFGTDHTEMGALAADRWHLPEDIVEVIRYQAHPEEIEEPSVRQLALALSLGVAATSHYHLGADPSTPFNPPASLGLLAQATERDPDELKEFLHALSERTAHFIEEMLKGEAVHADD